MQMAKNKCLRQILLTGIYLAGVIGILASGGGGSDDEDDQVFPEFGVWKKRELIGSDSGDYPYDPQIVMDAKGNAYVIWAHYHETRDRIWWNRYDADVGWGTPEIIDDGVIVNDKYAVDKLRAAVDSAGNLFIVWGVYDNGRKTWAKKYAPSSGWDAPVEISSRSYYFDFALNQSGEALVLWREQVGALHSIRLRRYIPGTGWDPEQVIEESDKRLLYPLVSIDDSGKVIAAWNKDSETNQDVSDVWASRFVAGKGWRRPEKIINAARGATSAIDSNGKGLVIATTDEYGCWEHYLLGTVCGSQNRILAAHYTIKSGWSKAEALFVPAPDKTRARSANLDAQSPRLAIDADGNAIAIWSQSNPSHYEIWANRFRKGKGWEGAERIENSRLDDCDLPHIAFDPHGNAIAVWMQTDGTYGNTAVKINYYVVGWGWGSEEYLARNVPNGVDYPNIAFDQKGNALAVWVGGPDDASSDYYLYARRFEAN